MLIIIFFLLFLVVGIVKLFTGQLADAAVALGFCAVLVFFVRWVAKEKKHSAEFLNWIKSSQEDLKRGWAYYLNQKITPNTEVTQYQGCVSFLLFTSRFRSRFLIVGQGNVGDWLIFSGLTFVFGWWGFPWGLIFTPQALYRNLRGGCRQSVGALMANIDAEIAKLTAKKTHKLSEIISDAKAEARA
jgi:hypothetical protein